MASARSSVFLSLPRCLRTSSHPFPHSISFPLQNFAVRRNPQIATLVSSSSSYSDSNHDDGSLFDDFASGYAQRRASKSMKSVLADIVQEIEPFDVSVIQKDVSPTTLDAMKRTISGILGLLPSDKFKVHIEALWEPLSKLLVSSMMTGYTLRNAEYRLCLEKNLGLEEGELENSRIKNAEFNLEGLVLDDAIFGELSIDNDDSIKSEHSSEDDPSEMIDTKDFEKLPAEAEAYIFHLQSQLSSVKKELHEVKRRNAALQMQQFVGEEKNDLLDYLRSLQPEKVAELSEPASLEVKETVHRVIHGLLATLSPKMQSKAPSSGNQSSGTVKTNEDCAELIENTSLQFQPLVSLTRDYLARLLFWCMLLGHYLRGLEYRIALKELLSLTSDVEADAHGC